MYNYCKASFKWIMGKGSKTAAFLFATILILSTLLIGCVGEKDVITFVKMQDLKEVSGSELNISNPEDVKMVKEGFNEAKELPGIVEMTSPDYKVVIGAEVYHL